jgi:hypothetical protein
MVYAMDQESTDGKRDIYACAVYEMENINLVWFECAVSDYQSI